MAQRRSFPLLEPEAYELVSRYGLPLPRYAFARDSQEACKAASEIGFPVVLKVVSPDIVHKSDVGGVRVGLNSACEVASAFDSMKLIGRTQKASIHGALVVEQAGQGVEVIIGGFRDEEFGPVVMFGSGGILVEITKDVTFGLAPVTRDEALRMILDTAAGSILKGVRGMAPADIEAAVQAIISASSLMAEEADVQEVDLNPVVIFESGCMVLDARILRTSISGALGPSDI